MNAWVAVASADHVRRGRAGGFMQVNHGKAAPLRRIGPGDGIVYYSPVETYGGKDRLQAFTALGTVRDNAPYQGHMTGGAQAWRRDVDWRETRDAQIRPLLDRLSFTAGTAWGARLRFGLLAITAEDFALIAEAMGDGEPAEPAGAADRAT